MCSPPPTTLMATLGIIAQTWREANQAAHALDIARESGALYDKFVGFIASLEEVGRYLERSQTAYERAFKQLKTGRGNLIARAEALREMGASAAKRLPEALVGGKLWRRPHRIDRTSYAELWEEITAVWKGPGTKIDQSKHDSAADHRRHSGTNHSGRVHCQAPGKRLRPADYRSLPRSADPDTTRTKLPLRVHRPGLGLPAGTGQGDTVDAADLSGKKCSPKSSWGLSRKRACLSWSGSRSTCLGRRRRVRPTPSRPKQRLCCCCAWRC